jgi:Ca2+/Na+ antiporter
MVGSLALALALSWRRRRLDRMSGVVLIMCYPAFVVAVVLTA